MPSTAGAPPTPAAPSLLWDVFCHVVDNLGDIGVCWRLSADLASRGQRVRLWIDQPEPLRWMAPGALEGLHPGVEVMEWTPALTLAFCESLPVADVWLETFGCDPPAAMAQALARRMATGAGAPVWVNLEYLSAEPYVERSHRLPSPVMSGPLNGVLRWFYYPGFTPATGGLLREPDLPARQAAFDTTAWLRQLNLPTGENRRVTVFCYEPPLLQALMNQVHKSGQPVTWLVTPGRAAQAVRLAIGPSALPPGARMVELPTLPQPAFDELLWASHLNLVRGEDSLVRALWAGRPFVWNIYPQHDGAHHAKLRAFLDWMDAPESMRQVHLEWNGVVQNGPQTPMACPGWSGLGEWQECVRAARQRLWAQPDLGSQLLDFVIEKR